MTSNSESTTETATATLIKKLTATATISRDAALSGGWSYPFLGIAYLVSHPSLYRAVAPVIIKGILVSLGITGALFIFTYLPQVAFCALFSGPLAFVAAFFMVLGEAYAIILIVSKAFFLGQIQDQIFDAVLVQQGNEHLVSRGREMKTRNGGIKRLGRSIIKPLNRFGKEGILRYIISLPLNSIPLVGSVLFFLYNGIKAGPGFHLRYFQLKGYDSTTRESFVEKRRGAYTAFGAAALALNVIPFVGLVFGLTSTVGAALWASDLEKKDASPCRSGRHVEKLRESESAHGLAENEVKVEL